MEIPIDTGMVRQRSWPQTRIQPTGFTIYGLTRQVTRQQALSNPDFTDMLLSPRGFRMK
ncbi:hypothetical protein [Sporomusa acidovorans]|uniref:hypothetical protein n=1 Tax=Sporomusa acidovorans TaxID=112900 RepID=UPI0015A0749B|nr:hypothetical protein [Sporomusa acidovorans]